MLHNNVSILSLFSVFEAVTAFTKTVRHDPLTGEQDNNQTRRWKAVGGKVQKQQRVGLKPEVKTSTVPQQRGRIPSISPVVAEVQVKESDHDSVVDKVMLHNVKNSFS